MNSNNVIPDYHYELIMDYPIPLQTQNSSNIVGVHSNNILTLVVTEE